MSIVRVSVLFFVDRDTEALLNHIKREIARVASIPLKEETLPFHMTIIGGGVVDDEVLLATLSYLRQKIVHLRENTSPRVIRIETAFLPYALGIRLIFPKKGRGKYVITGSRKVNQEMLKLLHTPFRFDGLPRHITLCPLSAKRDDSYRAADSVLPLLEKMTKRYKKELCAMSLTPEIWIKMEGGIWQCAK